MFCRKRAGMSWAAARSATVKGPPPALASSARARTAYSARAEISTPRVWPDVPGCGGTRRRATLTPHRGPTGGTSDAAVRRRQRRHRRRLRGRGRDPPATGQLLRRQADPQPGRGLHRPRRRPVLPGHRAVLGGQALLRRRRLQRARADAEALPEEGAASLYQEAVRLFRAETPVVAAVQGAAIGGGLGLACSADFRVAAPEARFAANFARLGFHHGFGLTVTLPHRRQPAGAGAALHRAGAYLARRPYRIGLCDRLAPLARGPGRRPGSSPARSPSPARWRSGHPRRPCGAIWPMRWRRPPTARTPSRFACGHRGLQPKVSGPARSGARRSSAGR